MTGRTPRTLHGGWTIGARHAGVVLALAILTPVFTSDLRAAQRPVEESITALVLDAPIPAFDKVALASDLSQQFAAERGRVPDVHAAVESLHLPPDSRKAGDRRGRDLDTVLDRAATKSFRNSLFVGAGLALAALSSLVLFRVRRP